MPLNDRQIKNAKPAEKAYKISDGHGLHLLIKPNGGKYWRLKYRIDGKEKLLSIGTYPTISLVEARAAAENARRMVANGQSPSEAKQTAKRERAEALQNTFGHIAAEWYAHQRISWQSGHAGRVWKMFERLILPEIGKLPIAEIGVRQIKALIESIAAQGNHETARIVLQKTKAVFNYAVLTERAINNPALPLVGQIKPAPVKHMPALPQSEITEFYRRVITEPSLREVTRLALLLMPLTFVRAGELRKAEWVDFDLDAKEWHIPAAKMKMKAPHIVPLSDWALALLAELHTLTGHGRYLFNGRNDETRPMSENALSYAMGRMGYAGIATPHGFRSLATDVLNENGYPPDVIERQLAHVEQNKVRAAYHRTEYLPQRREMMQWYSDFLRQRYDAAKAML
ncbi:tyrosine-type recombinase/integrase [Paralysiella testudinis]|uniref:Integrase arm-type DNA-binding domain-containing protein n=1 Tax=Paralysiella testudinis TaxID=2809020 RepID=A0A892ZHD5_9NEIS|nr:integrase arm-type DNA-binding domain-containing protein [Paralysiella testudinis]QRQ82342.1 integrase arm-type DNA-binding domain-containing protein [Paralysiella testudinis]